MTSAVYRIQNVQNGKSYIGSAVDVERRFRDHRRELNAGTHCNLRLLRAWKKYGPDAFVMTIVRVIENQNDLTKIETSLISRERTHDSKIGYNICKEGRSALGLKRSATTKAKMSLWQVGRRMSSAARAKMSASHKGIALSGETKRKLKGKIMSESARAAISAALAARGTPSAETRAKLSSANAGRTRSAEARAKMACSAKGNKSALGHRKSAGCRLANSIRTRKLTRNDVEKCRSRRSGGETYRSIAKDFGISWGTVRRVLIEGYL